MNDEFLVGIILVGMFSGGVIGIVLFHIYIWDKLWPKYIWRFGDTRARYKILREKAVEFFSFTAVVNEKQANAVVDGCEKYDPDNRKWKPLLYTSPLTLPE